MNPNRTQSVLRRIRNVTSRLSGKKWRKRLELAGSAASALGIFVAIWVATQGQVTVDRSSRASLQQSEDSQLSTAITAIGSDNTAEEIAGLLLLTRVSGGNRPPRCGSRGFPVECEFRPRWLLSSVR